MFTRTNYAPLEQAVDSLQNSKNIYDYYVANGFAGFWPSRFSTLASTILDNIVLAPTVLTYGIPLPNSKLTCEPLLMSVFNLDGNIKLNGLADIVSLAHEAKYHATGKFAAYSEGNTGLDNPAYVYEWVMKEDGSAWTIDDGAVNGGIVPIIYFKAAVGLLAISDTAFTENMAQYVESKLPSPSKGYSDGVDENGRVDNSDIDKTNGLIIEAAVFAVNNLPGPTSTGSSNPTSNLPIGDAAKDWYIIVFIGALFIAGAVAFIQVIVGVRKKNSRKLVNLCVNYSSAPPKSSFLLPLVAAVSSIVED